MHLKLEGLETRIEELERSVNKWEGKSNTKPVLSSTQPFAIMYEYDEETHLEVDMLETRIEEWERSLKKWMQTKRTGAQPSTSLAVRTTKKRNPRGPLRILFRFLNLDATLKENFMRRWSAETTISQRSYITYDPNDAEIDAILYVNYSGSPRDAGNTTLINLLADDKKRGVPQVIIYFSTGTQQKDMPDVTNMTYKAPQAYLVIFPLFGNWLMSKVYPPGSLERGQESSRLQEAYQYLSSANQ